jgi:SSS family solute:Na+ symporter
LDLSAEKINHVESTKDFFLAEGSLTWWAIGASSDRFEHFGRAVYRDVGEWIFDGFRVSPPTSGWRRRHLVIVAVFFMPIYLKEQDLHDAPVFEPAI